MDERKMEPMDIVGAEPPSVAQIRDRHERLLVGLRAMAEANGHDPGRLRIVAVTKTHPLELVRAAIEAGVVRLGENRVQEAEAKIAAIPEADWHLVGRLQSNKARRAVRTFATIHSIDSTELLRRVAAIAAEEDRRPALLLQVNVTGEASKAGMTPDEVLAAATVDAVRDGGPVGLMTIAPMGAPPDDARRAFRDLRLLRDRLEQAAGIGLPELSMGMSADAESAAAEGATLVRIGTAIFGPRS
ncbi:MAG TPA: YggS family pyridoxal phosphate-dependent enzyme [Candidatus Limnocylindria bacterium]